MTNEERDIKRKLRVLQHAEKFGNARKACRYFGVGRSSFYLWREAYQKHGEAGLKNAKSVPKNPANQTPAEIVEKVLYLCRKYHLRPIRIVWYLARYHGIKISDAGVYRILKRNGLNRLPRGTRMRKLHSGARRFRGLGILARWDHCMGVSGGHRLVAFTRVIRPICGDAADVLIRRNLVHEFGQHASVSDVAAGDLDRPKLPDFSHRSQCVSCARCAVWCHHAYGHSIRLLLRL